MKSSPPNPETKESSCYKITDQKTSWSHFLKKAQEILTLLNNGISFHLNEICITCHFWTRRLLSAEKSSFVLPEWPFALYFPISVWNHGCTGAENFSIWFLAMETSSECSLIYSKLSSGVGITYLNDEIQHDFLWQANSPKPLHLSRHEGVGFGKLGVCVCIYISQRV